MFLHLDRAKLVSIQANPQTMPLLFEKSQFSWAQDLAPARNQFVSFERRLSLSAAAPAVLHLFADTRYRLWVNDAFIAYGPGRFVTQHPEYDSYDLGPLLRVGENVVRVEVNYYGASSFQTMPDGLPGFIAAGGSDGGAIDFATPGEWKACIHQAWDAQSPSFSFAQNPVEICDTRFLANELAQPAKHAVVELPADSCPWPKPVPRSAPYPDYAPMHPVKILVAGPLDEPLRWGMQISSKDKPNPDAPAKRQRMMFSTWIHSPRDQATVLDCFWADLQLNGEAISVIYPKRLGDHGDAQIKLRAGWNFLAGNFEVILEHWAFLLGLPRESGASLHALPNLECAHVFAVSPHFDGQEIPPIPGTTDGFSLPTGWKQVANEIRKVTPARLMAWDAPVAASAKKEVPWAQRAEVATQFAAGAVWSFDFGDEYYGQPVIEVEAPAGTILDVAYDDWKRDDGCVALYRSNYFVDAADRFILRGGRQRIDAVNPRGGIYLQLILRAPEHSDPVKLTVHDVAIRRRTTITEIEGSFASGDSVLDWAWQTSVHTLQAATDEAYSDCPWRERGSYIGDTLVNVHLHRLASADLSVALRMLTVMGQAQREDGSLSGCAPAWLRGGGVDFTLIWILAVRDVWAFTGDETFLQTQWPVLQRIWGSSAWKSDADGLWDMTGMNVFLDWGIINSERTGSANSTVNILRVAAAQASAEIAGVLKLGSEQKRFDEMAASISAALMEKLWNASEGRFNPNPGITTSAVHANILALRFGVGPAAELLAYLEPYLRDNFSRGCREKESGHAELYFLHYVFPALAAHGKFELAEKMIGEHYGFLKSLGYPTLTECFHAAEQQQGSCCHSWSGAAALYESDFILGLRQAESGNPDVYLLDPKPSRHQKVTGSLPHQRGLIKVSWERQGGRIQARVITPPGVRIMLGEDVELLRES